ncbi:MAG TPA: glycogen synthase GlgA [Kofleriaceae bacterium]|nr:glycogen synthase GlgA [Kofleriaceae bacterium]
MRVLHVASEVAPFAQSGGLADVVAGLPAAEAEGHGIASAVLVPLYRGVAGKLAAAGIALEPGTAGVLEVGVHTFDAAIRIAAIGRVRYGFLDCAALYDRDGGLYGPGGTGEFTDNHVRFAALGKAALAAGEALLGGAPEVLHLHDWQGSAAAIYARLAPPPPGQGRPLVVTTIHNLAYRGIFPKAAMAELGIPWSMFTTELAEFYDQLSLLKAALGLADAVTTVSPSYAREILTPERGEALDGFLRWNVKRLVGIANGIDTAAWDPATDAALPARYTRAELAGKARCRAALAIELGLALPDHEPLIGVIARMTDQKGLDLVADIVPELARIGARLVVLGSGEPELERRFQWLAGVFRDHVAVRIGFDAGLARRIYAGSDLFAMPSRFEPCGLGQLYAMRYGTIPVVHAVGGLRDTVLDPGDAELAAGRGTGVRFTPATPLAFARALERAVKLFRDPPMLAAVRRQAMARDSSWLAAAQQYVQLYRSLAA